MADEYERLAEKTELSLRRSSRPQEGIAHTRRAPEKSFSTWYTRRLGWRVATRMNRSEAVNFLNAPPLTQPGEASVTNRSDGTVDIYWYRAPEQSVATNTIGICRSLELAGWDVHGQQLTALDQLPGNGVVRLDVEQVPARAEDG